jgi:uncharacterized protein
MEDEFSQLPPDESRTEIYRRPLEETPEEGVDVPYQSLKPETLRAVIEAFILRNGTDYGAEEAKLETKVEQVKRQLEKGEIGIVFDLSTETCSLVPKR